MKMKFKGGRSKVLTLSYDDAHVHDIRLIDIMNKYGLKGTFNVSSGRYLPEDENRKDFVGFLKLSEAKDLYVNSGNEVALHGFSHPFLNKLDSAEIIYEITQDKMNIENDYGVIARGMAYPYSAYNNKVINILKNCHIAYARTTEATYDFTIPENWLTLHPTCHHDYEGLPTLIKQFVETENCFGFCQMFYLWGHSHEFYKNDNWNVIEEFAKYAGGHEHIWYATNIEIYDYVKAYQELITSFDKKIIYNPSAIDVWVEINKEVYFIGAGTKVSLQ